MDNINKRELWTFILNEIKNSNVSDGIKNNFDLFLSNTKLSKINIDDSKAYVLCENVFGKQFIRNNLLKVLEEKISEKLSGEFSIILYTKSDEKELETISKNEEKKIVNSSLNPNYTFEDYIVSSKNRLLIQAAKTISFDPNQGTYNPLFIHGSSGLGKTHILHAIGNEISKNKPKIKTKYINAEIYGNEVVKKMMNKKWEDLETFKNEFINYDVLLFDDIQYIASREKTKETFFPILNTFIESGKQIVITSDSSPQELKDFEERFKTRFAFGLTLPITAPDFETSKLILKSKLINTHKINEDEISEIIDEEALDYISLNYSNSVRELEGILKLLMFWTIENDLLKITLKRIFEILGGRNKKSKITAEKIKTLIAKEFKIPQSELIGNSRKKEFLFPRQIAIYLCKELLDISLKKIGAEFNNRDHTTVMNAINKIENKRKEDIHLNTTISELKKQIQLK